MGRREDLRPHLKHEKRMLTNKYVIRLARCTTVSLLVHTTCLSKYSTEEGELEPLTKDELRNLTDYYFSDKINQKEASSFLRFYSAV